MTIDKLVGDAATAVADIAEGSSLAVGGFGACGLPITLLEAIHERGTGGLSVVSNNCGTEGYGLGALLDAGQIERVTASYIGDNPRVTERWLSGHIELELAPQGTIAERLRAGGSGIAAFFTRAGVGTAVADGGLPLRYHTDGTVARASDPKRVEYFDGLPYVLELGIRTDVALVRAARADRLGNLHFRATARNFNPLAATAGALTIAEVEDVVEVGALEPDEVHLPGIFVQRIVAVPSGRPKRIDRLTVLDRSEEWGVYR